MCTSLVSAFVFSTSGEVGAAPPVAPPFATSRVITQTYARYEIGSRRSPINGDLTPVTTGGCASANIPPTQSYGSADLREGAATPSRDGSRNA